jgi:hypothetical protein
VEAASEHTSSKLLSVLIGAGREISVSSAQQFIIFQNHNIPFLNFLKKRVLARRASEFF